MKLLSLALAIALAACTTPPPQHPDESFQTERVHTSGKVRLWVPPSWTVDDSNADSLVMSAPDGSVSLDFTVVDGKDLGSALLAIGANVLVGYDQVALVGSPVSGQINGMDALFQDGRATYRNRPVELSVGVIDTPADKYLLVVGEAESAYFKQHEGTIRKVIEGIRPM